MKQLIFAASLLAAGGCQTRDNPLVAPALSPVGEGLTVDRQPLPIAFEQPRPTTFQSLYVGHGGPELFSDRKAAMVGDVITVRIEIDDRAQFNNQSGRSRKSGAKSGFGSKLGWNGFGFLSQSGDISGDLDISSDSTFAGQGSIGRSEKLRLSVAAVVTERLPNRNLLISGSQEVMVNNEVRVLNIAGIVRPSDILPDNSVAYDKIAEARISYGGRGRISDVQQPGWGQRLYDKGMPF